MTENVDLKEIEKKAWTSYFQDGIWDIFLGLILLSFGIIPFLEDMGVPYLLNYIIAMVPAYVVFYGGKKYITVPRMGLVRFSSERKSKKRRATLALAASVIFGFIVMLILITNIISLKSIILLGAVLFGINAIVVFSIMAYFLDFKRLYIYGLFFASSIALVEFSRSYVGSKYDNLVGFGVFGGIMILIGAVYLIRFLHKYPKPAEAA